MACRAAKNSGGSAQRRRAIRLPFRMVLSGDLREMNLQLIANEENQHCAHCGENKAGGVISFVSRARKDVSDGATEDRSDNAKDNRPKYRHVRVHHRFRDNPGKETDKDIPDEVKHILVKFSFSGTSKSRRIRRIRPILPRRMRHS